MNLLSMKIHNKKTDRRPTIAEWPVRIWNICEFPDAFKKQALDWMQSPFDNYLFVYSPLRRTVEKSFSYLFGYGKDSVLFLRETQDGVSSVTFKRSQITNIVARRELLNAELIITYEKNRGLHTLLLPYVPSVYYLYDPFLNWMLNLDRDFSTAQAEQANPRPDRLYRESLAMFNYSLNAYRLGDAVTEYSYSSKMRRNRWMPWKKDPEEWLEIPLERGTFRLHSFKYLTECTYQLSK